MKTEQEILSKIKVAGLWQHGQPLKLHLGCGQWHIDGYINIDYPISEHTTVKKLGADLYADITELRFAACSVDEIRLHHVFEHFDRATAMSLLVRWADWLKPGGVIRIETPDLMGSAKTLLSNASWRTKMGVVRHLAGDQAAGWAFHLDHWFAERFEHTLDKLGFGSIRSETTQWPNEPYLSNVQVVAQKTKHVPIGWQLVVADGLLRESAISPKEESMWRIWIGQLHEKLSDLIGVEQETVRPAAQKTIETVCG